MTYPPFSFPRYLSSKRTVDDRALNPRVFDALSSRIRGRADLRLLEIGAGTGTMFQRLVDWCALDSGTYIAVDEQPENIAAARESLAKWGADCGFSIRQEASGMVFEGKGAPLRLELHAQDVFEFLPAAPERSIDGILANAFLDLVDVPRTLPLLKRLLKPGGLLYLTINFDGLTIMEPEIDARLDEKIMALYHRTMDERITNEKRSGSSRTGRRMFGWLRDAGLDILEAGSSDWTVFARGGVYPADEAAFLHSILHFFAESLADHPELSPDELSGWLDARREQIARGELVYIAHQMDFLAACDDLSR